MDLVLDAASYPIYIAIFSFGTFCSRSKTGCILMHEETIPGITSERSFLHCYNESYEGNFPLVST